LSPGQPMVPLRPEHRDTPMQDYYQACNRIHWYEHYRNQTNFPFFYDRASLERQKKTVIARKAFYAAERFRALGDLDPAVKILEANDALPAWLEILLDPDNHSFAADQATQEDSYEIQLHYLLILEDKYGDFYKELLAISNLMGDMAGASNQMPGSPNWLSSVPWRKPRLVGLPRITGFFDGKELADGIPLIPDEIRNAVIGRLPKQSRKPAGAPTRPANPPQAP
jgi:hypothetical protein